MCQCVYLDCWWISCGKCTGASLNLGNCGYWCFDPYIF